MSGRWGGRSSDKAGARDAALSEMPRAELLRKIEKVSREGSQIGTELINAGYGYTPPQEILKLNTPLSERYRKNRDLHSELQNEREYRMRYQGTEHPVKKSKWL
jgi:hypothetical protein